VAARNHLKVNAGGRAPLARCWQASGKPLASGWQALEQAGELVERVPVVVRGRAHMQLADAAPKAKWAASSAGADPAQRRRRRHNNSDNNASQLDAKATKLAACCRGMSGAGCASARASSSGKLSPVSRSTCAKFG